MSSFALRSDAYSSSFLKLSLAGYLCFVVLQGIFAAPCLAVREINHAPRTAANYSENVAQGREDGKAGTSFPERLGEVCSRQDIAIVQGSAHPLPNGIPVFSVQILNTCVNDCSIADIHVRCGWFSSARLVNPKIFRRLSFDDCLVNDGKPLKSGNAVSFFYSNTRSYPLSVSSFRCIPK